MAEKLEESLTNFMKKQASAKLLKKSDAKKSARSEKIKVKGEKTSEQDDEKTDEEKLEEAKKESQGKAKNYDQSGMIRKLFMENIIKYVLLITLLVVGALSVIKLGPVFFEFLHGVLFKLLFSGVK